MTDDQRENSRTSDHPARQRPSILAVLTIVLFAAACSSSDEAGSTATSAPTRVPIPVTASVACTGHAASQQIGQITVTVDGAPRTALVHLPTTRSDFVPLPVVLSFHGTGGSASALRLRDGFTAKADEEGFVVLHPQGLVGDFSDEVTDASGWDVIGREVDEPAFVGALLDELGNRVCINPNRVYATGFSNGASMAILAACSLPDRIAATAPVAAETTALPCAADRPTPMVAFHGTDDLLVRYDGSSDRNDPSVEAAMTARAERNGCAPETEMAEVTPTVETLTWAGCDAPTVLYRVQHHGHAWPGIPQPLSREQLAQAFTGDGSRPNPTAVALGLTPEEMADNVLLTNTDINATDVMWEFFTAISRPARGPECLVQFDRSRLGQCLEGVDTTSTVRDLVAGSGIEFTERGNHTLEGVPGAREILAAVT